MRCVFGSVCVLVSYAVFVCLLCLTCPPLCRSLVTVRRLRDGGEERAWVYHRHNPDKKIAIESGDWIEWLRRAPDRHPKAAALHYQPAL